MSISLNPLQVPAHIAIVMDGNGRWAKKNKLSTALGHKAGVETVRKVLKASREMGVKHLTLFAFSSENWQRPALEVRALMTLFSSYLNSEIKELDEQGVRIRFMGRRDRFSKGLLKKIESAELQTKNNQSFDLVLAVDYGGQWDIAEAAKTLAKRVVDQDISLDEIDPTSLSAAMQLSDLPHPDLMIRTSGEHRISNFLLWQLAYSEFYFTDVLWPDFDEVHLKEALLSYAARDRRFGGRNDSAQLESE